ncbi:helix-turn-helix transcriptional regulator [Streptomyces sp. 130]|uniref:helix-turn-helix domain-containing protein n=1 Tax=Streptomyces sp. 130 TaxID=2591006 RepID=UPI00163DA2C3|nr:helix-turn-helix transcriptional regulator [Streptomyces sp. 130]
MAKDIDGSAGVPQFYGKELRYHREEAGLTLEQLVEGSYYGIALLSAIEHGGRSMPPDLAAHVDRKLGTDFFVRRCKDVQEARRRGHAEYFARVLEAERQALTIEQWSPGIIPGLLQTEAYARAVIGSERFQELPEETDAKVSARLARAQLFEDDHKVPEYWVILPEALLWAPVLPPEQMAEQLDHIAALIRRGRIFVQIIPWKSGAHPLMQCGIMVLDFADAPPLVYMEGQHHGQTVDDPGLVKQYRRSYDLLRAAAEPLGASLAMIEAAAEEYRNGAQPARLDRRDLA